MCHANLFEVQPFTGLLRVVLAGSVEFIPYQILPLATRDVAM